MAGLLRQLNPNGRVAVLGLAVVLLIGAVVLARQAGSTPFVPLQRGLALAEAGGIAEALGRAGIEFRLGGGGTEISVAEADAARARVLLAKEGVPAGGRPGLELFDRPAWGMSDFTERVTFRRALEGELARTIGALRGVQRAEVHLALPASSALRRTDRPAEAAVVVALRAGATLSPEQVRGIAQLVSSSVDQLSVERVAVLDDTGRPLSGGGADDPGSGLSTRQQDMQRDIEAGLGAKVQGLLAAAVGPEAVRVQVSARLNFDQIERTIEAYDTAGQVLKSEQRSDVAPEADGAPGGPTVMINEYLNSRTLERIIGGVGAVTRLTVSAMVDSRSLNSNGELGEADRERFTALIQDAIGYDDGRGDRVTIVAMPFNGVPVVPLAGALPEPGVPAGPGLLEIVSRLAYPILSLLALVVALLLGWRAMSTRTVALQPALGAGEGDRAAVGAGGGEPLRAQAQRESLAEPQTAARVLRAWLTEAS